MICFKGYINKKIFWISLVILVCAVVTVLVIVLFFVNRKPFLYAGTLETTKVIVSARVPSDIADVLVVEGTEVESGQSLMRLSCDAYKILAKQINRHNVYT